MAGLVLLQSYRRPYISLLLLYILSIIMSSFLFYACSFQSIHSNSKKSLFIPQYFPIVTSPCIAMVSFGWMITKLFYSNHSCTLSYNFLEMPSSVFSSLISGISGVIEILYSTDFGQMEWMDKISSTAAVSVSLCALHAIIAFTLQ